MKNGLTLFFALFILTACSTLKVSNDSAVTDSFTPFKTFRVKAVSTGTDSLNNDRIITAVQLGLQNKGYRVLNNRTSDVEVQFTRTVQKDVPSKVSVGLGLGSFIGNLDASVGTSHRQTYDQETIGVSIYDKASSKVIWTGSAADKVNPDDTPAQRQSQINDLVNALLKAFPVRP